MFSSDLDWTALLPRFEVDEYREMIFSLLYVPHGGSGIPGLTLPALLELDLGTVEWLVDRLDEQRAKEAAALRGK